MNDVSGTGWANECDVGAIEKSPGTPPTGSGRILTVTVL